MHHHGVFTLRVARVGDLQLVLPRTRALNAHEGIAISEPKREAALRELLADPALGCVWLVEREGVAIGYAIVTFGYDLEFAGREGWLTELWIDADARASGAGSEALRLVEAELRARDVHALHLQVRADNPAMRVYERAGFAPVPRTIMSKRL